GSLYRPPLVQVVKDVVNDGYIGTSGVNTMVMVQIGKTAGAANIGEDISFHAPIEGAGIESNAILADLRPIDPISDVLKPAASDNNVRCALVRTNAAKRASGKDQILKNPVSRPPVKVDVLIATH